MSRSSHFLATIAAAGILLAMATPAAADGPSAMPRNVVEGMLDEMANLTEPRRQRSEAEQQAEDRRQDFVDRAELAFEVGKIAAELLSVRAEIHARIDALDNADRSAQREWEEARYDGPRVPLSCRQERCQECYARAIADIDRSRELLIRLRNHGSATVALYRAGEKLASAVQGASNAAAVSVYAQRGYFIDQPFATFSSTYSRKAQQMLAVLEERLQALGECERQHYNVPDWYNRFGFMYMTYMRDKYSKLPD
jgi:hypothetical protein